LYDNFLKSKRSADYHVSDSIVYVWEKEEEKV